MGATILVVFEIFVFIISTLRHSWIAATNSVNHSAETAREAYLAESDLEKTSDIIFEEAKPISVLHHRRSSSKPPAIAS